MFCIQMKIIQSSDIHSLSIDFSTVGVQTPLSVIILHYFLFHSALIIIFLRMNSFIWVWNGKSMSNPNTLNDSIFLHSSYVMKGRLSVQVCERKYHRLYHKLQNSSPCRLYVQKNASDLQCLELNGEQYHKIVFRWR